MSIVAKSGNFTGYFSAEPFAPWSGHYLAVQPTAALCLSPLLSFLGRLSLTAEGINEEARGQGTILKE